MTNPSSTRQFDGGCYCGNIRFTFVWPEAGETIPTRACSCTFCRKHGGVYTSHPDARLDVTVEDAGKVEKYRFGTGTADFHICRTCGVMPVITCSMDGTLHAVVNVNTLNGVEPSAFTPATADFDGETTEDRLARRKRNWVGTVTMT